MASVHYIFIFSARYLPEHMLHIIKVMKENHDWAASIFDILPVIIKNNYS